MKTIDRWYARVDSDPAVETWKKRVRKKPRGTLWPLHFQRTLGVVLFARGRKKEALAVWDEAAAVVKKSGRTDPWAVASWCAALSHWARGKSLLAKFADAHAAISLQPELWTKKKFAREIEEHWNEFTKSSRDDDELATDEMAFHLSQVALYRVIDVLQPLHKGKVPARRTDASLKKAMAQIAQR